MDETPIYLNMSTSTLWEQPNKRKLIIEHKVKKTELAVILAILVSGEKQKFLLFFKAKEGKGTERKLRQIECVEEKEFLYSNKRMHGIVRI